MEIRGRGMEPLRQNPPAQPPRSSNGIGPGQVVTSI